MGHRSFYKDKIVRKGMEEVEVKKKRYWLRGGLIGAGVGLGVILFLQWSIILIFGSYPGLPLQNALDFILHSIYKFWSTLDFVSFFFCGGICVGEEGMIHLVTAPISFLILGFLIGLIIEKIKSKKEVANVKQ